MVRSFLVLLLGKNIGVSGKSHMAFICSLNHVMTM